MDDDGDADPACSAAARVACACCDGDWAARCHAVAVVRNCWAEDPAESHRAKR